MSIVSPTGMKEGTLRTLLPLIGLQRTVLLIRVELRRCLQPLLSSEKGHISKPKIEKFCELGMNLTRNNDGIEYVKAELITSE